MAEFEQDPQDWLADLTPAEFEALTRHLAQCPLCQVALRPLRCCETPPEALLDGPPDDAERLVRDVVRRLRQENAAVAVPVPRQRHGRW